MRIPTRVPKRVDQVVELVGRGPWQSKSGGELRVGFALPQGQVDRFFSYDPEELALVPEDIRGLRVYTVRGIPEGTIGGTETHRVREEIVYGLEGEVWWECEDLWGNKREFVLTPQLGVWMPPYILHTYRSRTSGAGLLVVCNTLFNPDNPATFDTFGVEEFRALQQTAG